MTARKLSRIAHAGERHCIVAINRSTKPRTLVVPLPRNGAMQAARKSVFVDGFSGRKLSLGAAHSVRVTLAPQQAAVLLPATKTTLDLARAK
jgi:hypothetical protein